MAATAHAYLVSFLNTMDQIQSHPCLSTWSDDYQFQSLREMVDILVDFVENYPEAEDLMRRIGDAAHEAEETIQVEAADRICGGSTIKSRMMVLHPQTIIQEISSIKDEVIKFKEETGFMNPMPPPPSSSSLSSSSAPRATKKTTMLGFDHYVAQLLDELIGDDCRRILPIVGMGGAGKTTLARNLYEHSIVVHHFDVLVWVTVSQAYNASDMLRQALSCLGGSSNNKTSDDKLGEELHKTLSCRRYMIVLDDVWSVEAWEKVKFFFPQNDNGSRIVVTTRQQELVNYFGSSSLAVKFLDYENSWKLFCEVTFAGQECPPQLEQIAKMIVWKCGGLPLAIRVIGGLLRNSPRAQDWEKIVKDKSLVMEYSSEDNKPSNILYMSYKHLPVWLRSCFLYLGLFPEDHRIGASNLIKLWVAEGFIKPSKNQSLEKVAEGYIKELIDRNLLLVGELTKYKKVTSYCLHDLVRELCMRIAEKENFYCVQTDMGGENLYIFDERTASSHPYHLLQPSYWAFSAKPSLMHPLVLRRERKAPLKSRFLKVLINHNRFLNLNYEHVNMRYISMTDTPTTIVPWSISLCWSLQTLIVADTSVVNVPSKIWKMSQLKHIQIFSMIPDPPPGDIIVLRNLQTLKTVRSFTEELCVRIPNIRELEIMYDSEKPPQNVDRLNKLESLQICWNNSGRYVADPFENLKLPNSLTELSLERCRLGWSNMAIIALLPHLQLLKLKDHAVLGEEWNFVEEEFRSLKHLHISDQYDLVNWTADKSNFPLLETLYVRHLRGLDEIPLDIGEIPTLETIYVAFCPKSVRMSAIKILEEQENLGNQVLQLEIQISGERRWSEKIKESFTSPNLHIHDLKFPDLCLEDKAILNDVGVDTDTADMRLLRLTRFQQAQH